MKIPFSNILFLKNKKMISNNPVFDYNKTVENLHRKTNNSKLWWCINVDLWEEKSIFEKVNNWRNEMSIYLDDSIFKWEDIKWLVEEEYKSITWTPFIILLKDYFTKKIEELLRTIWDKLFILTLWKSSDRDIRILENYIFDHYWFIISHPSDDYEKETKALIYYFLTFERYFNFSTEYFIENFLKSYQTEKWNSYVYKLNKRTRTFDYNLIRAKSSNWYIRNLILLTTFKTRKGLEPSRDKRCWNEYILNTVEAWLWEEIIWNWLQHSIIKQTWKEVTRWFSGSDSWRILNHGLNEAKKISSVPDFILKNEKGKRVYIEIQKMFNLSREHPLKIKKHKVVQSVKLDGFLLIYFQEETSFALISFKDEFSTVDKNWFSQINLKESVIQSYWGKKCYEMSYEDIEKSGLYKLWSTIEENMLNKIMKKLEY